jgi:hypothetical protein
MLIAALDAAICGLSGEVKDEERYSPQLQQFSPWP